MKIQMKRFVSVLLAALLLVGTLVTASAVESRASYYFSRTEQWTTALSGGKIMVEFDVIATHTMTTLGAGTVYIYEKQSDGTYEKVKTYTRANATDILQSNTSAAYCCITYQGTPGTKYYAVVNFYAKDSSGYENYKCTTNTVTAKS